MASKSTEGLLRIVSGLKSRSSSTSGGSNVSSSRTGGGGGSSSSSNVEVKYYKSDGTPVYGAKTEKVSVPSGARAVDNANILISRKEPEQKISPKSKTNSLSSGSFLSKSPEEMGKLKRVDLSRGYTSSFERQLKPEFQGRGLNPYIKRDIKADATDTEAKRITKIKQQEAAKQRLREQAPPSTITAASPDMARKTELSRQRDIESRKPVNRFISSITRATGSVALWQQNYKVGQDLQSNDPIRVAGATLGTVGGIATWGLVGSGKQAVSTTAKATTKVGQTIRAATSPTLKALKTSKSGRVALNVVEGISRAASPVVKTVKPAVQVAKPVIRSGARVISKAKKIPGVPLTLNVGKGLGIAYGTPKVFKIVSGITADKEEKDIIFSDDFSRFFRAGVEAQGEQAKKGGVLGIPLTDKQLSTSSIKFGLTMGLASKAEKQAFEIGVAQEAKKAGKSEDEIINIVSAAKRQRKATIGGEAAGLLAVSTFAESVGQKYVTNKFASQAAKGVNFAKKGAFWKLFKTTFNPIGKAGFVEGAGTVLTQNIAREEEIKPKNLLIGAGVGYLSAGIIGPTIVGLSANKPTSSKVVQGLAYLSDPFEFPADVAERQIAKAGAKITGKKLISPVIAFNSPVDIPSFSFSTTTQTKTKSRRYSKRGGFGSMFTSPLNPSFSIRSPVNVNTYTLSDSLGIGNVINSPISDNTNIDNTIPINDNTNTDTNTNTNTNTNTYTDTTTNSFTNTDTTTNTNVNTNSNINIFSNVPVLTPTLKVPPPIPLAFPFSTGGGVGSRKVKKKRYVNELNQAMRFFNNEFAGFGTPAAKMSKRKKKR